MADCGYTKYPHWLESKLWQSDLTARELKAMIFIIRKTVGFNKNSDKLSYGQISKALGISRSHTAEVVASLEKKGWIKILRKSKCINIVKLQFCNTEYTTGVPTDGNRGVPIDGTTGVPTDGNNNIKNNRRPSSDGSLYAPVLEGKINNTTDDLSYLYEYEEGDEIYG